MYGFSAVCAIMAVNCWELFYKEQHFVFVFYSFGISLHSFCIRFVFILCSFYFFVFVLYSFSYRFLSVLYSFCIHFVFVLNLF